MSASHSVKPLWRTVRVFISSTFRDMHAATAHISMMWEPQATTFGRVALGLPCDNPTL